MDWINYLIGFALILRLSTLKFPLSPVAGFIALATVVRLFAGDIGGARRESRESGGGGD